MAIGLPSSTAQTPGTRSRAALRRDILSFVKSPDDPEANSLAHEAINDAILELNTRLWGWAIQTQDITLVADDDDYSLNSGFKAPRHASYLNTSGAEVSRVHWEDPKSFKVRFKDRTSSGAPDHYTVVNSHKDGLVLLSAPPNSGHVATYPTLRLDYYKRLAILTNDADELDAPSEVELFIKWNAKADVAAVMAPKMMQLAQAKASKIWKALVRDDNESGHSDWSY